MPSPCLPALPCLDTIDLLSCGKFQKQHLLVASSEEGMHVPHACYLVLLPRSACAPSPGPSCIPSLPTAFLRLSLTPFSNSLFPSSVLRRSACAPRCWPAHAPSLHAAFSQLSHTFLNIPYCLVILATTQCVRSTLLADKISSLLMCMIGPQLDVGKRLARTASLAPTAMRPGAASVLKCDKFCVASSARAC